MTEKKTVKNNHVQLNYAGLLVDVSSDTESLEDVVKVADAFMLKMSGWHSRTEKKRLGAGQGIG